MIQNTDTNEYLDAHREVLKVMDTARECMLKTI